MKIFSSVPNRVSEKIFTKLSKKSFLFKKKQYIPENLTFLEHYIIRRKVPFKDGEYEIARLRQKNSQSYILMMNIVENWIGKSRFIIFSSLFLGGIMNFTSNALIGLLYATGVPFYILLAYIYIHLRMRTIKRIVMLENGNVRFELDFVERIYVVSPKDLSLINEVNYSTVYSTERTPYTHFHNPIIIQNKLYYVDETMDIYDRELFSLIFIGKPIMFEGEEIDEIDKFKIVKLKTKDNETFYDKL